MAEEKENGFDSLPTYLKFILVVLVILFIVFVFLTGGAGDAGLFSFGNPGYHISNAFGIVK
tara:strand:- start:552 stop:734 length:183 start_codon:yes stop_codon:yes gene_type:complete